MTMEGILKAGTPSMFVLISRPDSTQIRLAACAGTLMVGEKLLREIDTVAHFYFSREITCLWYAGSKTWSYVPQSSLSMHGSWHWHFTRNLDCSIKDAAIIINHEL